MKSEPTDKKLDEKTELVLKQFASMILDQLIRNQKRNKRLSTSPDGYYMDDEIGIYTCFICRRNFEAKDIWYDKYGYKCRDCYNNVLKRVISKTLSKKRDSWCSDWEINRLLNICPATRNKLVRQGKLHVTNLKNSSDSIYYRIFEKRNNLLLSSRKS